MHSRQIEFTYSTRGPFTQNKERIQKFKERRDSGCKYENKLDTAYFQYVIAYGDIKDLTRTASDRILHDKASNIAKNIKSNRY